MSHRAAIDYIKYFLVLIWYKAYVFVLILFSMIGQKVEKIDKIGMKFFFGRGEGGGRSLWGREKNFKSISSCFTERKRLSTRLSTKGADHCFYLELFKSVSLRKFYWKIGGIWTLLLLTLTHGHISDWHFPGRRLPDGCFFNWTLPWPDTSPTDTFLTGVSLLPHFHGRTFS